jgi:hypothetical protein
VSENDKGFSWRWPMKVAAQAKRFDDEVLFRHGVLFG